MIALLSKNQIADNWEVIKFSIMNSLPPTVSVDVDSNFIMKSLMDDTLQCWSVFEMDEEGNQEYHAIITTMPVVEPGTEDYNLLIYSLFSFKGNTPHNIWIEGFEALKRYASSCGYKKIIAYTKVPFIINKVKELGGDTEFTLVRFNV